MLPTGTAEYMTEKPRTKKSIGTGKSKISRFCNTETKCGQSTTSSSHSRALHSQGKNGNEGICFLQWRGQDFPEVSFHAFLFLVSCEKMLDGQLHIVLLVVGKQLNCIV